MSGEYIIIPKGKKVKFKRNNTEIPGVPMILEDEVTVSMSSSFSEITKGNSSTVFSLIAGAIRDAGYENISAWAGGQFKQLGFQTWTGTAPLSTTLTVNLTMNNDAKKDVVDPTLKLSKLCLPEEGTGGALIPPGPSISSALQSNEDEASRGKIIHCYIGNYVLRNVLVKRAQPTFSKFVDNNGYPISSRVELEITTLFSATTQMVETMLGGNG